MTKKQVTKITAVVMASVMALGFIGCGTEKQAEKKSPEASGKNEVSEVYWFSDVSGWGPAAWNNEESSPALDYMRENLGLTFNIEQPPTDADTKLGLMIATNELPDVMSLTDADTIKQLIKSDKVWGIQEFLEKYDPESHLLKDFPEDIKKALTDTYGGWYSYPSHMESEDNRALFPPDDQVWIDLVEKGSNGCIMFNKDIMDELGITQEDVQTEQGFYEACQKVKDSGLLVDGQEVIPLVLQGNLWLETSLDGVLANNFGVVPVDEEGHYRHRELSPGYKNAMKFVNNCIQNGYLDVNTLTIDETVLKTYLDAKRVFCWIGNQAQQTKDNMPWVSYGPIIAENEARPALAIGKSAGTGWIQTLISKDCENPEKIAKMISWASSREGLLVNYYGTEGEDYTIDEKGIVTKTEAWTKTMTETYKDNVLLWPFANTSFERNTEPVPDPTTNRGVEVALMPAMGKFETTYIYDSSLLSFETSNVIEPSSDLGVKLSQVKSYLESQKAKVITAATDETFEQEYDAMIRTLNEYDIEAIDEAYDKVFQENCSNTGEVIEDVNAALYQ